MSYASKNIRNIVLLGHSGSGKTTLAETMLYESGAINRRGSVEERNTVSDYTHIEKEKGNSLFSTLMHVKWRGNKINIIDTPGSDDFVGEVASSLKVADTALVVLNAAAGVEVGTEIIWDYVQDNQTPALFIINQMDHSKANYEETLAQVRERFGDLVIPVQYPLESAAGGLTIVDALRMVVYDFGAEGGKPSKRDIPEAELPRARAMHNALVEAAAENDDTLMERYFEAGTLSEEELQEGLTLALAHQKIYPVFCVSSTDNMGTGRVMGFLNDIAPSPADRPPAVLEDGNLLVCNPDGEASIFIYKTITEPQVGMVSYFKVYSGMVQPGQDLYNAQTKSTERLTQIYEAEGKERKVADALRAGDIGVTVKLKKSHTNNTLNGGGLERRIEAIHFPKAKFRTAVVPPSKTDMEKLMKSLYQIAEEDPTLQVVQSSSLQQTILHGQGQLHLDMIKYRIEKVNGIAMDFERPRIPYRETITSTADVSYRHKKQSGGSGQFAEVHLRVEPYVEGMPEPAGLTVRQTELIDLPWGGQLSFYWCIVGGSIDSKYANAIKKGILQKMETGPLTGSHCQHVRVSIYDGKMHSVDSNDMAFMIAAGTAFKQAFEQADPQILEPIYNLELLCSDTVMGDIMSDLQTRRATIVGMDSDGHYQKILARVPLAELYKYSATLRSISQGRAKFQRSLDAYEAIPFHLQEQLIHQHKELQEV